MKPLFVQSGFTSFSINNELRKLGIPHNKLPPTVATLYDPTGYAFIGYRGLNRFTPLPDFANHRTVFLVRDPRDMLVSLYYSQGFSHRPPGSVADDTLSKEFEARRKDAVSTPINHYALSSASTIREIFKQTATELKKIHHRSWRYEDIIFAKKRWTEEMVNYLEIDVPPRVLERVVARNDVLPSIENEGEHIRRVTPGDFRNKLDPQTIEILNQQFSEILATYGYS